MSDPESIVQLFKDTLADSAGDDAADRELDITALLAARNRPDLPEGRAGLARKLRARGFGERLVDAMAAVPRHAFAPRMLANNAYLDNYLWTEDTVLSTPSVVALMIDQLNLNPSSRVLEIGTGTGYQTAVLAVLAGTVFSVDRVESCVTAAREATDTLGLSNVSFRVGDGYAGWAEEGPFDAVVVAATPPYVPHSLLTQLSAQYGRMVLPVGPSEGNQRLYRIERRGNQLVTTDLGPTYFVPMLPEGRWADISPGSAHGQWVWQAAGGVPDLPPVRPK
jgi:protein-L-isoaspartate(D-aspartate) O-methyltransferase